MPLYEMDYALKREIAERAAAAATDDSCARFAHHALAERYADRIADELERLGCKQDG